VLHFRNFLIIAMPFFVVSALVRLYALWVLPHLLQASLWWGIAADLLWSLLPAALVLLVPRFRATVMVVLLLCWSLTHWLDAQSLIALGVGADYRDFYHVLDPVFLKSTLSHLHLSALLGAVLLIALLAGWCRWLLQKLQFENTPTLPAVLVVGGFLLLLTLLPRATVSHWNQQNSVGKQLKNAWLNMDQQEQAGPLLASRQWLESTQTGTALTALPGAAHNVLLIVLEGLPGAYLPQVSASLSQPVPVQLEQLGPWAARGWLVPQFINHTRQTLRGLYSILCADYPRLIGGTPKPMRMLEYPRSGEQCLPARLRRNGYHTAFLQAADLEFMSKGLFMPLVGFEQVEGQRSFEQAQRVTNTGYSWGPTDAEFFTQLVPKLQSIDAGNKPWFVTLLTAGTHFPYGIEAEPGATALHNKLAAVEAVDRSAAGFLQTLQEKGLLEDTLVIVTSDEAHGIPGHPLGANWGLFFALAADLAPTTVEGLFGSVDVSRSISDYLGLDFPWGESVFREADPQRALFFGHGTTVAMARDGLVHQCGHAVFGEGETLQKNCSTWEPQGQRLFAASYQDLDKVEYLKRYRELVDGFGTIDGKLGITTEFVMSLAAAGNRTLQAGVRRFIGGGNYIDIPVGSVLTFDLDVAYRGRVPGSARITLEGKDANNSSHIMPPLLLPTLINGGSVAVRYIVQLPDGEDRAQFNLKVDAQGAAGNLNVRQFQVAVTALVDNITTPAVQMQGEWSDLKYRLQKAAVQMEPLYRMGDRIAASDHPEYFLAGWYNAEAGGVWSKASGMLRIPIVLDVNEPLRLIAKTRVDLQTEFDVTTVDVFANGQPIGSWNYQSAENWIGRSLMISPATQRLGNGYLNLEFRPQRTLVPGPRDSRALGMFLTSLVLQR